MFIFSNQDLGRAPMLLNGVSKSFDDTLVVNNLNLEMKPGEILGLLGPNGAGKSTTINMISGVLKPDQGSIQVFGFDCLVDSLKTRRLLGVMHQEPVIEQYLSIGKSLEIHSGYYGVSDDPAWRELIIENLNLGPHLAKRYLKLSGGMRRRFMIAKTLLHKPRLLILDEPTAGVDVELRSRLWEFVREINRVGISVLLTTHYLDEAEEMCDRVAFLKDGKLVALEPTRALIEKVGEQKLSIRFASPVDSLPKQLNEYKPKLGKTGSGEVFFSLKTGSEVAEVLNLASKLEPKIEDVVLAQPDLEDVFLRLTSK